MLNVQLKPQENIGIVCASGLGDALIFMVLANNLQQNGHHIALYSSALQQLSNWFPQITIVPFPTETEMINTLNRYNHVIISDRSIAQDFRDQLPNSIFLKKNLFNRRKTLVDNLYNICKKAFHLNDVTDECGIEIPLTLTYRKYPRRIAIHPESADPDKNWPADKFIQLARHLIKMELQPVFIMSPKERIRWMPLVNQEIEIPVFNHLNDTAAYLYESGWMIGNDSGIGHLASALGIPTLSLFRVKSKALLWRPGWKYNQFVVPTIRIPGNKFRGLWKQLLSVKKVFKAFKRLMRMLRLQKPT